VAAVVVKDENGKSVFFPARVSVVILQGKYLLGIRNMISTRIGYCYNKGIPYREEFLEIRDLM
jgi:hypothetical protein